MGSGLTPGTFRAVLKRRIKTFSHEAEKGEEVALYWRNRRALLVLGRQQIPLKDGDWEPVIPDPWEVENDG